MAFGLEDRTRRHEQPLRLARRDGVEAAERRGLLLQAEQRRLAQHRQLGELRTACDRLRIERGEMFRPAGGRHRVRDRSGETREQILFARRQIAGFESVEVVSHASPHSCPLFHRDSRPKPSSTSPNGIAMMAPNMTPINTLYTFMSGGGVKTMIKP